MKSVRAELVEAQATPVRISKRWIEDRLSKYYKEHPRCKHPTFVAMADFNNLKLEFNELERSHNEGVAQNIEKTVQELTKSKSSLRQALATIAILEGEGADSRNQISELTLELSAERTRTSTLKTTVTELKQKLPASAQPITLSQIQRNIDRTTETCTMSEQPIQRRRTGPLGQQSVNIYTNTHSGDSARQCTSGIENTRPRHMPANAAREADALQDAFNKGMDAQCHQWKLQKQEQEKAELDAAAKAAVIKAAVQEAMQQQEKRHQAMQQQQSIQQQVQQQMQQQVQQEMQQQVQRQMVQRQMVQQQLQQQMAMRSMVQQQPMQSTSSKFSALGANLCGGLGMHPW